jgi:hypothetical protein
MAQSLISRDDIQAADDAVTHPLADSAKAPRSCATMGFEAIGAPMVRRDPEYGHPWARLHRSIVLFPRV